MFNFLNIGDIEDSSNNSDETIIHRNSVAKFDLTLTVVEAKNSLNISIVYCTKLFNPETIERFIQYFKKIVEEIRFDKKLSEIEIIKESEKVTTSISGEGIDICAMVLSELNIFVVKKAFEISLLHSVSTTTYVITVVEQDDILPQRPQFIYA
jgi:hypothetical protein